MSQPVRYRPKDRDQITWERDRVRLQTEARLFMSQVMNRALFELGSERRFQETPSDTDCQFLILKHVIGQVCAPERHSGCFYTGDQVKITDSAGEVLATAERGEGFTKKYRQQAHVCRQGLSVHCDRAPGT